MNPNANVRTGFSSFFPVRQSIRIGFLNRVSQVRFLPRAPVETLRTKDFALHRDFRLERLHAFHRAFIARDRDMRVPFALVRTATERHHGPLPEPPEAEFLCMARTDVRSRFPPPGSEP